MKTKIQARFVIGFSNNDHVILKDAEVVYEHDIILFVGHDYPQPVDRLISAGDAIISPGFIDLNALGDIDHDILRLMQKRFFFVGMFMIMVMLRRMHMGMIVRQYDIEFFVRFDFGFNEDFQDVHAQVSVLLPDIEPVKEFR